MGQSSGMHAPPSTSLTPWSRNSVKVLIVKYRWQATGYQCRKALRLAFKSVLVPARLSWSSHLWKVGLTEQPHSPVCTHRGWLKGQSFQKLDASSSILRYREQVKVPAKTCTVVLTYHHCHYQC